MTAAGVSHAWTGPTACTAAPVSASMSQELPPDRIYDGYYRYHVSPFVQQLSMSSYFVPSTHYRCNPPTYTVHGFCHLSCWQHVLSSRAPYGLHQQPACPSYNQYFPSMPPSASSIVSNAGFTQLHGSHSNCIRLSRSADPSPASIYTDHRTTSGVTGDPLNIFHSQSGVVETNLSGYTKRCPLKRTRPGEVLSQRISKTKRRKLSRSTKWVLQTSSFAQSNVVPVVATLRGQSKQSESVRQSSTNDNPTNTKSTTNARHRPTSVSDLDCDVIRRDFVGPKEQPPNAPTPTSTMEIGLSHREIVVVALNHLASLFE